MTPPYPILKTNRPRAHMKEKLGKAVTALSSTKWVYVFTQEYNLVTAPRCSACSSLSPPVPGSVGGGAGLLPEPLGRPPEPDGGVVGGRGQHVRVHRVPVHAVHGAGVAAQDLGREGGGN